MHGGWRRELDRVTSTQDELRALAAAGAPAFSVVRAEEQTAGRGRRGRTWAAPHGRALLASVLLRSRRPPDELPALGLLGGLAVCEVARDLGAPAEVRWPNDVVVGGRKLAGVLPELLSAGGPDGAAIALGIGVNVRLEEDELPPTDRLPATSLWLAGLDPPAPAALLDSLLDRLRPLVETFEQDGLPPLLPRLERVSELRGRRVRLELADGRVVDGLAAGIAPDGALVVRTPGGIQHHRSGEVARVR